MSQISTSLTLSDGDGATLLAALNEQFAAFQSSHSGPTEPTLTVVGMLWFNTTDGFLYIRDVSNAGWNVVINNVVVTNDDSGSTSTSTTSLDSINIAGDVFGTSTISGTTATINSIINLPNVILVDGGTSSTSFVSQTSGPYGVLEGGAGVPDGGTTGQILIKDSDTDGDASWQDISAATITIDPSEYCPGYTYVYISATSFKVTGLNTANVFAKGRRLRMTVDGTNLYGIVDTVAYVTDTTITMTMESGSLTAGLTEVCVTSSATSWSPISADPFSGSAINDIVAGTIGSTNYWIIVGDGGKLAYSTNDGIDWTLATSNTANDLISVAYNETNQEFIAVERNINYISTNDQRIQAVYSSNGSTWTFASSSIDSATNTYISVANILWYPDTNKFVAGVKYSNSNILRVNFELSDITLTTRVTGDSSASPNARVALIPRIGTSYLATISPITQVQYHMATTGSGVNLVQPYASSINHIGTLSDLNWGLSVCFQNGDIGVFMPTTGAQVSHANNINPLNMAEHSSISERAVFVGELATILYLNDSDLGTPDSAVLVSNGFSPTANILAVHFGHNDGIFIAVADNGQICRSTSGVS